MLRGLLGLFQTKKDISIRWAKQGEVKWNPDWVEQYGKSRSHIPTEVEHTNFANYDLGRNNLPLIIREQGKLVIKGVNEGDVADVLSLIRYHGFEPTSID